MRSFAFLVTCVTAFGAACGDDAAPPGGDGGLDGISGDARTDANLECSSGTLPEMCDFFTGCGCDVAAGQKCSIGPTSKRCASAGEKLEWDECANDGECAAGTACVEYPMGGGTMRCLQFCDVDHACPLSPEEACFINITSDLGSLCGEVCNLLSQDCQLEGQNCHALSVVAAEKGGCVTAGASTQGGPCGAGSGQACAEGFNCVTPDGSTEHICAKLCDRGQGDADCSGLSGGPTCKPLAGHTQTGICLP